MVVRLFWVDCRPTRTAAVVLHGSCNEAARKRLLATDCLRCLEVIETRVEKREMGGASVPTGCDSIGSADACSARSPAQMQTQHCSASALRQAQLPEPKPPRRTAGLVQAGRQIASGICFRFYCRVYDFNDLFTTLFGRNSLMLLRRTVSRSPGSCKFRNRCKSAPPASPQLTGFGESL